MKFSLIDNDKSKVDTREYCKTRDKISVLGIKRSCQDFLTNNCKRNNCRNPHLNIIEINDVSYASDLRYFKKFDTTSIISKYVHHRIRQRLSDHDALNNNDNMITWNTMSRLGSRQKESIMNFGGEWNGYPTGTLMPWDELRFIQIAEHISGDLEFKGKPIMCFQEMDYSIVELLRDKLAETHYLNFTESDQNSNTGGLLMIVRKDSYSIEEQTDHRDKWLDKDNIECSKLVGSLITIKNINDSNVQKILNVHLDLKSAEYSIPFLIESIVSNKIDFVIGDFNLHQARINELLKHESFTIELISEGYDHICKIIR
jgi:hypothetical protein